VLAVNPRHGIASKRRRIAYIASTVPMSLVAMLSV
jgi:hypothetical protein